MSRRYRILLISSSGGVLLDLLALEPWWKHHDAAWAVVPAADTLTALAGRQVFEVTERKASRPWGAVLGFFEAWRVLRAARPELIVSAGSGVAIGFFVAARLRRIPSFWVETFNFIEATAMSGRICSRLASEILVQRPSMLKAHPKAVMVGELY